jgi:membrane-associated phospholipid phosphatase
MLFHGPSIMASTEQAASARVGKTASCWIATAVLLAIDGLWLAAGGWRVQPAGLVVHTCIIACLASILLLRRFREEPRVARTVLAMSLLLLFSNVAAVFSYLVVSTDARLVDDTLSAWDHALGFDWWSLYVRSRAYPHAMLILQCAYFSLLPQLVILALFLGFSGRIETLTTFIELFVISSLCTILISGLVPAAGPWMLAPARGVVDAHLVSQFEPIRAGTLRTIDLLDMQGLISMPSLHTILALLIVYAMWSTPLRYAFVLLNVLTIAATPIVGGHYLVDLLAGAVLVTAVIAVRVLAQPRAARSAAVVMTGPGRG